MPTAVMVLCCALFVFLILSLLLPLHAEVVPSPVASIPPSSERYHAFTRIAAGRELDPLPHSSTSGLDSHIPVFPSPSFSVSAVGDSSERREEEREVRTSDSRTSRSSTSTTTRTIAAPAAPAGVAVSVNNNVEINLDGRRLRSSSPSLSTSDSPITLPTPLNVSPLSPASFPSDTAPPRLGSSVGVGGAVGSAPPVPLTLVDDNNRPIARGFFQPTNTPQPQQEGLRDSDSADRVNGGTFGRRGLRERLGVGLNGGSRGTEDAGDGGGGNGMSIAITDENGDVVSRGRYFADSSTPSLTSTSPPLTLRAPSSTGSAPTHPVSTPSASIQQPQSLPPLRCWGNEYDDVHCPLPTSPYYQGGGQEGNEEEGGPSSGYVHTPYHAKTVFRSRTSHPRRVVVVPQSFVDFAKSDVTMSLSPSLASYPPVPPFMARPQSAAAAIAETVRVEPAEGVPLGAPTLVSPVSPPVIRAPAAVPIDPTATQFVTLGVEEEESGEANGTEEGDTGEDLSPAALFFLLQVVDIPLWAVTVLPEPSPLSANPLYSPVPRPVTATPTTPIFGVGTAQTTAAVLGLAPSGSAGLPSGLENTVVASPPTSPEFNGIGLIAQLGRGVGFPAISVVGPDLGSFVATVPSSPFGGVGLVGVMSAGARAGMMGPSTTPGGLVAMVRDPGRRQGSRSGRGEMGRGIDGGIRGRGSGVPGGVAGRVGERGASRGRTGGGGRGGALRGSPAGGLGGRGGGGAVARGGVGVGGSRGPLSSGRRGHRSGHGGGHSGGGH